MREFAGEVWRYIPRNAFALDVGYVLRASGRWNRPGEYGCIYTAFTRAGAIAEYTKILRYAALLPEDDVARDLVTIKVDVKPIFDLGSRAIRRGLGVTEDMLMGESSIELEVCRSIADLARSKGYAALRSPSAAKKKTYILVIYIDGRSSNIDLNDGSWREPLNYGPNRKKNFS